MQVTGSSHEREVLTAQAAKGSAIPQKKQPEAFDRRLYLSAAHVPIVNQKKSSWCMAEESRVMKIQPETGGAKTEAQFMIQQLGSLGSGASKNAARRYMDQIRLPGKCLSSFFQNESWPLAERLKCARAIIQTAINYKVGGLAHPDIKPDNMIYDSANSKIGFIDHAYVQDLENPESRLLQPIGTRLFIAPEQFESMTVSEKTMVYSLGITLLNLFSQKPYEYGVVRSIVADHPGQGAAKQCVKFQLKNLMPEFWDENSQNVQKFRRFLLGMVSYEPAGRPTLDDCLTGITDLIHSDFPNVQREPSVVGRRNAKEQKIIVNKTAAITEQPSCPDGFVFVNSILTPKGKAESANYLAKAEEMNRLKLAVLMDGFSYELSESSWELKKVATDCAGASKLPEELKTHLANSLSYQVKMQLLNELAVFIYCNSPNRYGIPPYSHQPGSGSTCSGSGHAVEFTEIQSIHMSAVVSEAKKLVSELLNSEDVKVRQSACHFLYGSLAATFHDNANLSDSAGCWGERLLAGIAQSGQWCFSDFTAFAAAARMKLSDDFRDGRCGKSENSKQLSYFMEKLEEMCEVDAANELLREMECNKPLDQLIALEVQFLSILTKPDAYIRGDHDPATGIMVSVWQAFAGPSMEREDILQSSATKMKHIRLLQAAYGLVLDSFGEYSLSDKIVEQVTLSYLVKCSPVQYQHQINGISCALKVKAESLLQARQNIESLKRHYQKTYTVKT